MHSLSMETDEMGHGSGVALQVLGSGGPMHGGGRGSAAYLVWGDDRPLAVVDMGGDTPLALQRAGVAAGELPLLLLSHVHPDHVSGLPDFFWGEMTATRRLPLTVVGPPSSDRFRDIGSFLDRLFGADGAFPDMQTLLAQQEFPLHVIEASSGAAVYEKDGIEVRAHRVAHGRAPSIAFRVEVDGLTIVFGGDQTARDADFCAFAAKADLLVMHAMIGAAARGEQLSGAVALPEDIGRTAALAEARGLLLSHLMEAPPSAPDVHLWSLPVMEDVRRQVAGAYRGPIDVASDLAVYPMANGKRRSSL
jgi:ribonuclease Z